MKNKLLYKLKSGKNPKFIYFGVNFFRLMIPKFVYRYRLERKLKSVEKRSDADYIKERVVYYNKLSTAVELPLFATALAEHKVPKKQKVYFFDTYQYVRWFPQNFKWGYCPGDVTFVPEYPSIVKSRPLGENENSVLMKLDKVRHFIFVNDKVPFKKKKDTIIFRGKVKGKLSRKKFMEMYFNHPMCDLGDVSRHTSDPSEWEIGKKTIREHLDYKFILALEGNDVASNLKWVMSSNSIAVMPRPTCETWFMEGKLIPDYHYIEIESDFSDLEERLNYYIEHEDEALAIIENAHKYIAQFRNREREMLISLLILDRYFRMTGQK